MDHQESALLVEERLPGEEVAEVVRFGVGQHAFQRVRAPGLRDPGVLRQQVEVVVPEDEAHRLPLVARPAEHPQRVRPPVHQVADEPDPIAPPTVADAGQQLPEGAEAPLHIPDRPSRHGGRWYSRSHAGGHPGRGQFQATAARPSTKRGVHTVIRCLPRRIRQGSGTNGLTTKFSPSG